MFIFIKILSNYYFRKRKQYKTEIRGFYNFKIVNILNPLFSSHCGTLLFNWTDITYQISHALPYVQTM